MRDLKVSNQVSRGHRGFTLVELLVAMAISSIVILAVCAASDAGWRLWRRVEDRRPAEEQARRIIDMMRTEWAGLYLPPAQEGAVPAFVHFEDRDRGEQMVSFCTAMPSYYRGLPPGRCAQVTYEFRKPVSDGDKGGVLVRREQLLAGETPIAEPTAEVIATNLASFAMEYLDREGKPQQGGRQGAARPPRMVKLQMAWPVRNALTGQDERVFFSSQFLVAAEAPLLPDEQGPNAGS